LCAEKDIYPAEGRLPTLKATKVLEVLAVNLVLLLGGYLVLLDEAWRASYAAAKGYSPSVEYSFLTHLFTLGGGAAALTSPLTLDWIQVFAFIALVYDALFVFRYLRSPAA
jgi:hypothetical protein